VPVERQGTGQSIHICTEAIDRSNNGDSNGSAVEGLVIVGLGLCVLRHVMEIAGRRLLRVVRVGGNQLGPGHEPMGELKVQEPLDIAVPVMFRGHWLQDHLVEAEAGRVYLDQRSDNRFQW
jgi:hypothetical protein